MLIHNIFCRAVSEHVVRNGVPKLPCMGTSSATEAKISAVHSWGVSQRCCLGWGVLQQEHIGSLDSGADK